MLDTIINYHDKVPINVKVSHIHEQPVHTHNNDLEIIVLLRGTVKVIVGYKTIILQEGKPFIINDMDIHGIYELSEDNLVLTVHINLNYFRKYNEIDYDSFFLMAETYLNDHFYDEPLEELKNFLFNLCTMKLDRQASDESLETMCADFLEFLLQNFQYFYYSEEGGRHFVNRYDLKDNQAQAFRMRSLMYYLWDNYDQKITLKRLADETNINMYYLSHMIKTATGLSFQDLLNFTRVEQSEILLLDTNQKISTIALDCGFSATRYYEKFFKIWFQVSPEEYRRRNMQRYTLPFKESVLDSGDALSAINEYVARTQNLSYKRTSFYTNVIEIDVDKKTRKRKAPFPFLLAWNHSLGQLNEHTQRRLEEIENAFLLCAPIWESRDLSYQVETFLMEDDPHSLLLQSDYMKYALSSPMKAIMELINLCRSGHLSKLPLYITIPSSTTIKGIRQFTEKLTKAGRDIECAITVKGYIRERFDQKKPNYFLDSIFAATWILRSCLDVNAKQELVSTIFDNDPDRWHLLHGGSGIITDNGICKPSFYAYYFLSMLGKEILYDTEDYIITRKGNDIVAIFYDCDTDILSKVDDYSDWKRLLVHYGSRRYREYKLELNNFAGKYSATEILLDNSCCIFSKMAGLKMPDYLNSEDESLMQECLKPEVRFSTINGLSEPSVYDIQVPRFGALCLKLHQLPD